MRVNAVLVCTSEIGPSLTSGWLETYEDTDSIQGRLEEAIRNRYPAYFDLTSISDDENAELHQFILKIGVSDEDYSHWFWLLDMIGGVFD